MESQIEVCHISIKVDNDFDNFTQSLEGLLRRFDRSLLTETDPGAAEKRFKEMGEDFIIFEVWDHGTTLSIFGYPRNAKQ